MDTIWLETKELLTYHCGCIGNLVTMVTRYVADAYCPNKISCQIWTPIQLKTKELFTYLCGCLGNLVTMATRYVADACCPKELPYQIWTHYNLRHWSDKCRVKYQESSTGLNEVFRPDKCKILDLFAGINLTGYHPPGHPGAFAPKCVPIPRAFVQQKMLGGRANI